MVGFAHYFIVMMAIQLDLFSGQPVAPSFEGARDYDEPAHRAGIDNDLRLEPCRSCPLKDYCSDECGRLGFSVSVNDPVRYGFHYRYR